MLDALRLALGQAGAAVLELNAVAAGIGQKEGTVTIADRRVAAGQYALAIGYHPVAPFCAPDHSTGLPECLAGLQAWRELLRADHVENQFHGCFAPCD